MTEIFLQPGEYHVGSCCRVRTLLGSCVSIVLWHPECRVGAMCHFLLARRGRSAPGELDGRYGEEAVPLMVRGLVTRGVSTGECTARVFGGGNMFPEQMRRWSKNIGEENGRAAIRLVEELGIPIVATDLFGHGHRHVLFDVEAGTVWVRHVATAGQPAGEKPK